MHREHPCTSQPLEPCRIVLLLLTFMQAFPAYPSPSNNSNNLQRKHNQCRMPKHILSCWAATTSSRRVMLACNNNHSSSIRIDKTSRHNRLHQLIQEDSSLSSSQHSQHSRRCGTMSSINQHSHQPIVSIIRRRHQRQFPCDFTITKTRQVLEILSLYTWHHKRDKFRLLTRHPTSNISRQSHSSCRLLPHFKRHKVRRVQETPKLL